MEEVVRKHLEQQGVTLEEASEWAGDLCSSLVRVPEVAQVEGAWEGLAPAIRAAIMGLIGLREGGSD